MNPYNPATQFDQWLAWEKDNAAGGPKAETPKPEAPKASAPPAAPPAPAPGVKPSAGTATLPGTAPKPPAPAPFTPYPKSPPRDLAAENAANKKAQQLATGNYRPDLPPGYTVINNGQKAVGPGGQAFQKDMTTNLWSPTFSTKAEQQLALTTLQTQQQNTGLRNAIATSAQPPEQRTSPTAIANSAGMMGTLGKEQGITVPGFEQYNQPGAGFASEGRHTLYDNGLNTLAAGRQGSATQIPVTPVQRGNNPERYISGPAKGNNVQEFVGGPRTAEPQMKFPTTAVSVPDTYVRNEGNTGDAMRAIDVPFNIGPGGASSFQLAGNNVQLNSADKGTGMGFAINPMPASNFAMTNGRMQETDPALQAAQTLQIMAAQNQGATPQTLTATNPNQYGGFPAGTGNGPASGNGGMAQGTWFADAAPGPQNNVNAAVNNALVALADQKDKEDQAAGFEGRSFGRGGSVVMLPRRARARSPLGFGSGGDVLSKPQTPPTPDGAAYGPPAYPGKPASAPAPDQGVNGPPQAVNKPASPPAPDYGTTGPMYETGTATTTTQPPTDFDPLNSNLLDPFVRAQEREAQQQRNRDATNYQWGLAGRPAPTAIDVPLDYTPTGTPASGTYYSRIRAINDRINGITSGLDRLRALGPDEDYAGTQARIAALQQQQQPFQQAMSLQTQRLGLGGPEDYEGTQARIAALLQQRSPFQQAMALQTQRLGLGANEDYEGTQARIAALQAAQQPFRNAMAFQTQLQGLGPTEDPSTINARITGIRQAMGPLATIVDANQKLTELGPAFSEQDINGLNLQMQQLEAQANPNLENPYTPGSAQWLEQQQANVWVQQQAQQAQAALLTLKGQMSNMLERNRAIQQATDTKNNLLTASGLTWDQVNQQTAQYQTALQNENQNLDNAQKAAQLRNQITQLVGEGIDPSAKFAELSGQLDPLQATASGILSRNQQRTSLDNEIARLAGQGVDPSARFAELTGQLDPLQATASGILSRNQQRTNLDNEITRLAGAGVDPSAAYAQLSAQLDPLQTQASGILSRNQDRTQAARALYNLSRTTGLPGFKKGGWIKTATSNAHGQFAAKAKAAGMSTKAYASQHAGDSGTLGKQARLAKTLMGFAGGGDMITMPKRAKKSMVTPEEIVGIGRKSGTPYFRVGEPRRPGGPPAPEKLTITPLPMGKRKKVAA